MGRLLDEAINQEQTGGVELRDSLNSSHRAAKKYDSYGFEIEEWSDDIASKAAGLQRMSENVLASMFEVKVFLSVIFSHLSNNLAAVEYM